MKTAAVLTISDKGYRGEREDTSGPALVSLLENSDYKVIYITTLPDEFHKIKEELIVCCDSLQVNLVLTTGGTGFSPRDITPEATLAVMERETRGIPEAMRAASMQITPRGCLSRAVAGIRKRTLMINLPGSKKAALENIEAVLPALDHGLDMLLSEGSADCGENAGQKECCENAGTAVSRELTRIAGQPSLEQWLAEAKQDVNASRIGMYLTHNGVVRQTARAKVREGAEDTAKVKALVFSYDAGKLSELVEETKKREGIYYVRAWLNEGELQVGEPLMYVLIGGDIRPHVMDAMDFLVSNLKNVCVKEKECF